MANFMRIKLFENFSNPLPQSFDNRFSPKCVGEFIFRFQIGKQRENPHQMISIDIRFIPHTPTQNELSIFEGFWRLRIMEVSFKGLKLWPSFSEGSITLEKFLIECIKPWKCRRVKFLSEKVETPPSFL